MKGFFLIIFNVYFDHMKPILAIFCVLMTFMTQAQTSVNPCDSIFIHSCQPNATGIQIEIVASNHSIDIISYPGFILLADNGDTIAVEEVNYFGIGWNEQIHVLNIVNQPTIPSPVTLELHSHFYDSLRCSWSLTLGSALFIEQKIETVQVIPNPAKEWIEIKDLHDIHPLEIKIFNAFGKDIKFQRDGQFIDVSKFPKGMYYLELRNGNTTHNSKFLIQ